MGGRNGTVLGRPPKRTTSLRSRASRPPASYRFRFLYVRTLVVFAFAVLAARLVYVQAVLRSDLRERADRQGRRFERNSGRFRILDRNGLTLAESVEVLSCYVDPTMATDRARTARDLARALGLDESALARKL